MGLLGGKYAIGAGDGDSRHDAVNFIPVDDNVARAAVDAIRTIGAAHSVSPSQVALAWLLSKPGVTSLILGATRADHLTDSLRAVDLALAPEEIQALDCLTAVRPPYPAWHAAQTLDGPVEAALASR